MTTVGLVGVSLKACYELCFLLEFYECLNTLIDDFDVQVEGTCPATKYGCTIWFAFRILA